MTQDILVSVIVPVYNILDYLERCVDSICRQTYQNLEIILVDDGSTDGTADLCDALEKKDERIRIFHKENGGSSSARNLGIRKAQGTYLGFVDSDDYIDEDMYERLVEAVTRYQIPIAQVGRDEIDMNGNVRPDVCIPPKDTILIKSGDFLRELLLHRGDCSFCTKLVKKELFEQNRFPEGVLNEDFYLLTHMLPAIEGIISLPCQSYHVFYRIGSNTRKKDENEFSCAFADSVDNAGMVQEIVDKEFPELKKIALRFNLYQRLEYLLHIPIPQMKKSNRKYREIVAYIRRHWFNTIGNPYLTAKNKIYLTAFAAAPKTIKKLHRLQKKGRRTDI